MLSIVLILSLLLIILFSNTPPLHQSISVC
jgi:hypothetical protein